MGDQPIFGLSFDIALPAGATLEELQLAGTAAGGMLQTNRQGDLLRVGIMHGNGFEPGKVLSFIMTTSSEKKSLKDDSILRLKAVGSSGETLGGVTASVGVTPL